MARLSQEWRTTNFDFKFKKVDKSGQVSLGAAAEPLPPLWSARARSCVSFSCAASVSGTWLSVAKSLAS